MHETFPVSASEPKVEADVGFVFSHDGARECHKILGMLPRLEVFPLVCNGICDLFDSEIYKIIMTAGDRGFVREELWQTLLI